MKESLELLAALGVRNYTPRHVHTIDKFVEDKTSGLIGLPELLSALGSWDAADMQVAVKWYESIRPGQA